MISTQDSPFHIVIKVVKGEGPDFMGGSPVDVPVGSIAIGTLGDISQMIGSQALFNTSAIEKAIMSLGKERENHKLTPEGLLKSMTGVSSRACAIELLVDLFWESAFSTLPDGDRWVGNLVVCKGWQVVGMKDKVVLLPDIALPSKKAISRFFDIIVAICSGKSIYDDTVDFPEKAPGEISVGTVESNLLRQIFIMEQKFKSVLADHDPYPGFSDEILFFKERPFVEYAAWRHASGRLKRMIMILNRLSTLGIMNMIDIDQVVSIIPSLALNRGSSVGISIRKDWEIVFVP